jgi:hypothetical protein
MIKFLLSRVIKWAASLTWVQFLVVVQAVKDAGDLYPMPVNPSKQIKDAVNINRAAHVTEAITRTFTGTPLSIANFLREVALIWVRRSK